MGKILIEVKNVYFSYNKDQPILRNINTVIYENDFIALIGKNGCGKTTLSKHFNGILKPSLGQVLVYQQDTTKCSISQLASKIGYCYQNPDHQIFNSTLEDEMKFGPINIGMPETLINEKVEHALKTVGLNVALDTYPFSLSKGERQKLAVASILAMETPVIIVDEPSTGMDWRGSTAMMNLMKTLNEQGHTVIVITHDMRFVAQYAKRVIVMNDGEIIADASPLDVLSMEPVLQKANLVPPQITCFMNKLNQKNKETILDINIAVNLTVDIIRQKKYGELI